MSRWKRNNTVVFNISYHIIWTTKYRKPLLIDTIEARLKDILFSQANKLNITIESMEIMSDHVHLFIKADPSLGIPYIMNQFKGYSSSLLRKEFKILRTRVPTLWTRSYYIETIGHISEDTVKKYIEDQKNR